MRRRNFCQLIGAALPLAAADSRPNLVFILTDDQRRDSLACYGNRDVRTPHIDRLAQDGVLFERASVTSAICTPSRACYFLGQYERRHGVNFNSGTALSEQAWQQSYPMALRQAGYFTGYVGKNHVPIGPKGYETGIVERSFDFWYGGHGHLNFYPKQRHPIFKSAPSDTQPEVLRDGALSFLDSERGFIQGAQTFLKQRPAGRPFCLSICFNLPHAAGTSSMKQLPTDPELYRTAYRDRIGQLALPPHYTPKTAIRTPKIPANVLYAQYRQKSYDYVDTEESLRERRVREQQTVSGIDGVVGAVRDELRRQGIDRNTVIVFASDHGIMSGEFGLGGKGLNYEACLAIPMIVLDPRLPRARQGVRCGELVQSIDIAPTLLDLARAPKPATVQGRSLVALLRGEAVKWRDSTFAENLWSTVFGNPRVESVRTRDWKYIRYFASDRALFGEAAETAEAYGVTSGQAEAYRSWLTASVRGLKPDYEELFDLVHDSVESANLAADPRHRATLERMRQECDRLVKEAKGDLDEAPATVPLPPARSSVRAD